MTADLGPLPLVHPRHVAVEKARRELGEWRLEWQKFHDLTLAEELMLLSEELNRILALTVRHEREKEKTDG